MTLGAQATAIPPVNTLPYADLEQEAWPVEDDFADLYAVAGMSVLVVDFAAAGIVPRHGHKVVGRRYHPIRAARGDLSHAENFIRLVVEADGKIILKSMSSNPAVQDIAYNPDDKSVEILKLIIGRHSYEQY